MKLFKAFGLKKAHDTQDGLWDDPPPEEAGEGVPIRGRATPKTRWGEKPRLSAEQDRLGTGPTRQSMQETIDEDSYGAGMSRAAKAQRSKPRGSRQADLRRGIAAELQTMSKAKFPQPLATSRAGGYGQDRPAGLPGAGEGEPKPPMPEVERQVARPQDISAQGVDDYPQAHQFDNATAFHAARINHHADHDLGGLNEVISDYYAAEGADSEAERAAADKAYQEMYPTETRTRVKGRSEARSRKPHSSDRIRSSERGGHRLADTRAGRGPSRSPSIWGRDRSRVAAAIKMLGF